MKELHPDHDTHWKELIEKRFWNTIAFFLPKIYALADQSKGVEFLDKELHKLIADKFKGGNTRKDKLAKIHLKNGKEHYVLIHFEVQTKFEKDFLRRMFVYFYRIFDKREENITALVIYTGDSVPEDCDTFKYEFMGTKVIYQFNVYRVCDAGETALLEDDNPMALAVLAAKYLNDTKDNKELRYRYKLKLIELTRKEGWTKQEVATLLQFIDLMIILPKPLEIEFKEEVLTKYDVMNTSTHKSEIAEFFLKQFEKVEEIAKREAERKVREKFTKKFERELKKAKLEFTEQITQEVTEQVKQEVTEQVRQEVKQEFAEQVKQEVTEQVKQEFAEQVKQEVTEQVKQEFTEQVKQESRIESAKNLLSMTDLAPKQIAEIQALPIEVVLALKKEIER